MLVSHSTECYTQQNDMFSCHRGNDRQIKQKDVFLTNF